MWTLICMGWRMAYFHKTDTLESLASHVKKLKLSPGP